MQPLNHGLNSAWQHAQDRGRWKQLVEMAALQSGALTKCFPLSFNQFPDIFPNTCQIPPTFPGFADQ